MKKLLSTNYSAGAFNAAILFLRLISGLLIMQYGYDKLVHFAQYKGQFMSFMGIGSTASLALVVFAEFFCGLFIIIGLFTRLACVPLIVTMAVVLFKVNHGDIFAKDGESVPLFLVAFLVILLVGPGKVSVDGMTGK